MTAHENLRSGSKAENPEVTIIVPARNEELNLKACLSSLVNQRGPSFEIIVVDDDSQDKTRQIAESFAQVRVIPAAPLEAGWTGKANAIQTALPFARGQWLLFTDADTTHMPGSLEQGLHEAKTHGVSMLSFSPKQDVGTFWERAVQPVIFSDLAMTFSYEKISDPSSSAAAANGQYILVSRREYEEVGGHSSVKGSLLEDVDLARRIKRLGPIRFRYGPDIVSARMYQNAHDLIEGWTKNLAGLFPNPVGLATRRSLEAIVLILGPFAALFALTSNHFVFATLVGLLVLFSYLNFAIRLRRGGWNFFKALPSLIGLPLFCFLLFRSFIRYSFKKSVKWKGRTYFPRSI